MWKDIASLYLLKPHKCFCYQRFKHFIKLRKFYTLLHMLPFCNTPPFKGNPLAWIFNFFPLSLPLLWMPSSRLPVQYIWCAIIQSKMIVFLLVLMTSQMTKKPTLSCSTWKCLVSTTKIKKWCIFIYNNITLFKFMFSRQALGWIVK